VCATPAVCATPNVPTTPAVPAVPATPAADEFGAVMGLLAARRHAEASFVEQQFLGMLKRPLESWGELVYDAPDHLEKRTLQPRPETLLLAGDVLTLRRGGRSQVIDLRSYPQILPVVASIRATLAGDRTALERVFRVEFRGDPQRWSLLLEPLDAALAKTVAGIRIDGAGAGLRTVDFRQPDGDHSLMTIRPHGSP
jgi:hypothetical protein